jgi:Zn-finger nucleic acid-binding protein
VRCPVCENKLTEKQAGDIWVDVCEGGCGGIWFDPFELKKVDEPHESAGEVLLEVTRDESVAVDPDRRRDCPKCGDVVMMRHYASVRMEIAVDECPKCGGFWLDQGELRALRDQFQTEESRRQAARETFAEMFDGDLAALGAESQEKLAAARKIAHILRFLCPSKYIPGKQPWGAY